MPDCVIDGRLHSQREDGLFYRVPVSSDELHDEKARGIDSPAYHVVDGKPFEVVDGAAYAAGLKSAGKPVLNAEKSGAILVRQAQEGEDIPVYTQGGLLEANEKGHAGKFIATKADLSGRPIVDAYGHMNSWQLGGDVLSKKYDIDVSKISGQNSFAKPKGGEQQFVQVEKDIAVMVPWGENGSLIPLAVERGGYLNVTNPKDVYGISARDFADTYQVNSEESSKVVGKSRNRTVDDMPDIEDSGNPGMGMEL